MQRRTGAQLPKGVAPIGASSHAVASATTTRSGARLKRGPAPKRHFGVTWFEMLVCAATMALLLGGLYLLYLRYGDAVGM